MLNTVFHEYARELILLQHDGFASKSMLNMYDIEQLVKDKTGFDIGVKEWQICTGLSELQAKMKFLLISPMNRLYQKYHMPRKS